jgi:hypothetical protein
VDAADVLPSENTTVAAAARTPVYGVRRETLLRFGGV